MMPENLIIKAAGVKDAELLTKLSVTTFCDAFGPDNRKEDIDKYVADEMNLEKLSAELADGRNIFLLAFDKQLAVGYAKIRTAINIPEELRNTNPIEIERLYVLQAYHNKKIGAALIQCCIEHGIQRKHNIIWLGVWEHNDRAIKFYKRYGFEVFGAHGFLLGYDAQTDVLMKKSLE